MLNAPPTAISHALTNHYQRIQNDARDTTTPTLAAHARLLERLLTWIEGDPETTKDDIVHNARLHLRAAQHELAVRQANAAELEHVLKDAARGPHDTPA